MDFLPRVVFSYHAIDRHLERFYHVSKLAVRNALLNPDSWLYYRTERQNADNRNDGKKMKIALDVHGNKVIAIAILKVENGKRVMVIPTVHKDNE